MRGVQQETVSEVLLAGNELSLLVSTSEMASLLVLVLTSDSVLISNFDLNLDSNLFAFLRFELLIKVLRELAASVWINGFLIACLKLARFSLSIFTSSLSTIPSPKIEIQLK